MTADRTTDAGPVGSPVEREVRPFGYVHGEDFIPHGPNGWTGGVPVYDQTVIDAAVAAERERLKAMAHSRAGYEAASAAHHAGKWHAAFEHHMTRNAAMCDLIDALFGPNGQAQRPATEGQRNSDGQEQA